MKEGRLATLRLVLPAKEGELKILNKEHMALYPKEQGAIWRPLISWTFTLEIFLLTSYFLASSREDRFSISSLETSMW